MGLRLTEGINPSALAKRLGVECLVDDAAVDRLALLGLLERNGPKLAATPRGRLLLDTILAEIAV